MAKLDRNQLIEVSQLIDSMNGREASTIYVSTVFVDNEAGENIGSVTYDHDAESFVWIQNS